MSYTWGSPFRYDVVGSFLRPDVIKQARADHAAGVFDDAQLKVVEYEAIRDLVAKQKTAYEISECDWSSDVCSSDLSAPTGEVLPAGALRARCVLRYEALTQVPVAT